MPAGANSGIPEHACLRVSLVSYGVPGIPLVSYGVPGIPRPPSLAFDVG